MKHLLKYLISLLITSTAIAQCDYLEEVVVDSPAYTIETQFQAIFFKPSTNNLYYTAEAFPFNDSIAVPVTSPSWLTNDIHPNYHFGFDLGLRGIIHSRNSSLCADWKHFHSRASASLTATGNNMVGPFSSIGPDASPYKIAMGCVSFNFNEANVRYGQFINFGSYLQTNLFAGISIAKIKQCLTTNYSNPSEDVSRITQVPSSFIGAGPQCGLDFNYNIVKGFNLTGQTTIALLMGRMKNHTTFYSFSPLIVDAGDPEPNVQNTCVDNRTQMVPSFEEILGLGYSFSFREHYMIKISAGYDIKVFINAIQSSDLSSGVTDVTPDDNTVGVFARTFARTLGNFSLGGPYVAFNVAF